MPAANLVCPHCEKPVELQVTAVTRSRPCPKCEQPIMLQFTQKQGRVKRRALLVTAGGGAIDFDALKSDQPLEEPLPLPGDAFERMKADPELIAIKKRFAWSFGAVAALIVVAATGNWAHRKWWSDSKARPASAGAVSAADDGPAVNVSSAAKDSRIATAVRPEKRPSQLDFTAQENKSATGKSTIPVLDPDAGKTTPPRLSARNPVPGGLPASVGAKPAPARISGINPLGSPPARPAAAAAGEVPKSLFRVATRNAVVTVSHDLDKARAALQSFLRCSNINQRLQYIASRPQVENRARAYYSAKGDGVMEYIAIKDSAVVGSGSSSEHDVVLEDGRVRRATVIKAADGRYLVEWPSFVLESDMDWEQFIAARPSQPALFRVTAEMGDHYESSFADSKWLLCLKLHHPAAERHTPVYAYVDRKSALGREIAYWLKQDTAAAVPLTLRLKYPPDSITEDQVWVDDLVAVGWVIRDPRPVADARIGPASPPQP